MTDAIVETADVLKGETTTLSRGNASMQSDSSADLKLGLGPIILELKNVDKFYGRINEGTHAVKDVSIDVREKDIVALLGSSGCGKTSILRMIAGFEATSRGSISLAGREIQNLKPVKRNISMAFEAYSLYPTVTVRDNIAFALKASRLSVSEVKKKVESIAAMLEISDILHRYPTSISGGQQQRVSLARALIRDADLYLLDEPMGQLEPQLRTLLRGRIKRYIKERGLTAILVTHDQTEANGLADNIAVMENGVLQQYDRPEIIKSAPANLFTGTFIGEPPMNVFAAKAELINNKVEFDFSGDVTLSYNSSNFSPGLIKKITSQKKLMLGMRPYALKRLKKVTNSNKNRAIQAQVQVTQWLGDQTHIVTRFSAGSLVLVEHDRVSLAEGETIAIEFPAEELHIFDGKSGAAISHGGQLVL